MISMQIKLFVHEWTSKTKVTSKFKNFKFSKKEYGSKDIHNLPATLIMKKYLNKMNR